MEESHSLCTIHGMLRYAQHDIMELSIITSLNGSNSLLAYDNVTVTS